MYEDKDFIKPLDRNITLEIAAKLQDMGFKLRNPEAFKAIDIYDEESVLWTTDREGTRAFSHFVCIDYECIYDEQDYPDFIHEIADAVEVEDSLTDVSSTWDWPNSMMTVKYTFDGAPRELTFDQCNDWIPTDIAEYIVKDIATVPGRIRLAEADAQGVAIVWIYPDKLEEFLRLEPSFVPWPPER